MPKKLYPVSCSLCKKTKLYAEEQVSEKCICIECITGKKTQKPSKKIKVTASTNYANTVKGKREDLGENVFRSRTEANFARLLEYLNVSYEFESKTFYFEGYKRKPFGYLPDFFVSKTNPKAKKVGIEKGWYEIKGWMNAASRSKLRRFKKHYPEEAKNMIVVLYKGTDRKAIKFCKSLGYKYLFYSNFKKIFSSIIKNWE